ncbi:HIRAN domain-containing protein [Endozoicomonas sp. 8E]|uniref:HIRAN domain-containing protein n=1 Tax=Endozoicomonas sp. 8E TaxID=3035692 RepID=UPI002938EB6A|nr:HIRAN domain-containing protein [Endozoicomonas sp. 8E]WOG27889.1 HIRAN domain-containing protein [Endozoicomonas sp. 8E]
MLEAFVRRLPPRSRSDFYRYMELRGLNPDAEISDFALLGYAGARLPDDGFGLVHPFDNALQPFELITEVAGFRHEAEVTQDDIAIDAPVQFVAEPDNVYDNQAIRIELNGRELGYVDRGRLSLFHRLLNAGHDITGSVMRKNGTADRPLIYIFTSVGAITH